MLWFSHAPRNAAAHFGVAPTQLSNEMKLEAGHIPCHLPCGDGAVSRIGDNTTVGFSSRTSGARSTWRECAENMLCFSAVKKACLRARSKPLPKEWLGSSDRAYQRLSTCVEKSRAIFGRARPKTGLWVAVGSSSFTARLHHHQRRIGNGQ